MNEHHTCPTCGEVGRATTTMSRRSFRRTHEDTCGTTEGRDWLTPVGASWVVVADLDSIDLRDVFLTG